MLGLHHVQRCPPSLYFSLFRPLVVCLVSIFPRRPHTPFARVVLVRYSRALLARAAHARAWAEARSAPTATCKFCGLHRPDMVSLREHQCSCAQQPR